MRYLNFSPDFLVMQKNDLIGQLRLISKFMTSQIEQELIAIHILSKFSRCKGNQTMKFGQLTEYNMRNIFLQIIHKIW